MHLRATNAHLRSLVRAFSTPIKNISTFFVFCLLLLFWGRGTSYFGEEGDIIKILLHADHYRPASETPFKMAFRWHVDDSPILNADRFFKGSGPLLLKTDIVVNSFTARRFFNCLLTYMK